MRLAKLQRRAGAIAVACVVISMAFAIPAGARSGIAGHVGRSAIQAPGPPTWPANPRPIPPTRPPTTRSASTASSTFDWGAAGIGAGGAVLLVGATVAGIAIVLRRRGRPDRSSSLAP